MNEKQKQPSTLADLRPHERNPRTITAEALDGLKESVGAFGDISGIVWNTKLGCLVTGHQRVEALKNRHGDALQIERDKAGGVIRCPDGEFRVRFVEWDQDKTDAALLVANNQAIQGDWTDGVTVMLKQIGECTGELFNKTRLDELLDSLQNVCKPPEGEEDAEPQMDLAEEINKTWQVAQGDLWQIGKHRLFCGDSTKREAVDCLLVGATPNLMVTDPPYGVEYDAEWRNQVVRADGSRVAARATGRVLNDDRVDWTDAWKNFPGDVAYVWHAGRNAAQVQQSIEEAQFQIRAQIIWAKQQFAIGRGDYHWKHEPCWYAVRKGRAANFKGDRKQTTLWEIDKPQKSETGHSTQKPLECMARAIRNHTGDVYEPFAGSGTTLVAAQNLSRTCYAIELHPPYCAVILDRMRRAFKDIDVVRIATNK